MAAPSKIYLYVFKMKNFATFSLFRLPFCLLHENFTQKSCKLSHKISHLPFKEMLPKKLFILPTKFINFFLLMSPLEMVSPGAARPIRPRLSTLLLNATYIIIAELVGAFMMPNIDNRNRNFASKQTN